MVSKEIPDRWDQRVTPVNRADPDQPDLTVIQVNLDSRVLKDPRVKEAILDLRDKMDSQDQLGPMVVQGHKEPLVPQDNQDLQDLRVHLVMQELQVQWVRQVSREQLDRLVLPVPPDLLVSLGLLVLLAREDQQVREGSQEIRVMLVHQVHQVGQDPRVNQDHKARPDHRDSQEHQELAETPDLQVQQVNLVTMEHRVVQDR